MVSRGVTRGDAIRGGDALQGGIMLWMFVCPCPLGALLNCVSGVCTLAQRVALLCMAICVFVCLFDGTKPTDAHRVAKLACGKAGLL